MTLKGRNLNRLVTWLASLGVACFGYDQGVMGGIIELPTFRKAFNAPSALKVAIIVSLFEIGALIGAVICGRAADRYGRIKSLLVGCITLCLGATLQAASSEMGLMITGRVIGGIGLGFLMTTVPLLQSELSPAHRRGKSQSLHWIINILGFVLAYWLDYAVAEGIRKPYNWRIPIAAQCFFAILLIGGLTILPESPRWLIAHGKIDGARDVLLRITEVVDENDKPIPKSNKTEQIRLDKAEAELEQLNSVLAQEIKLGRPRTSEMFSGAMRRATFLAMGIQAMQQLTGINAIAYYQVKLIEMAGHSVANATLLAGVNAVTYMLATLIPVFTVERLGRRLILIVGALMQCLALLILGVAFILKTSSHGGAHDQAYGICMVFGVFMFTFVFGSSWLSIPWTMPPELFPTRYRSKGCSFATMCNFLFNTAVGLLVPPIQEMIGGWLYVIFGLMNLSFAVIIYYLYPETAGVNIDAPETEENKTLQ